ncbi:DUF2812 domain-containing protein [Paenibacillus caui]|uniref:DUF2812 domain-containing protein n=1 Tax=Paenibacillus caui TaxID=2873927 RepID=UPI001CA9FA07
MQHVDQKNRIYKIDYRTFNKNDDFQEYRSIFEDAGWTLLAQSKGYSKHIFYTDLQTANRNIFSDTESYKEREKQRMSAYFSYILISVVLFIISMILYNIYDRISILGAGCITLFSSVKFIMSYYKHRKVYKSLL